jgi:hypothetical protein
MGQWTGDEVQETRKKVIVILSFDRSGSCKIGATGNRRRIKGNGSWMVRGEEDEYFMDCQYEYFFVSDFDHYGFVSHHAGECVDSVVEEGII